MMVRIVYGLAATAALVSSVYAGDGERRWVDARELLVEGRGWDDTATFYERLPQRAAGIVPEMVQRLSRNTAGICVRFVSDSPIISAIWDGGGAMSHMAATGNSGLDLYRKGGGGEWTFCGVGKPLTTRTTAVLARGLTEVETEYLLYLPLYHDVSELKVGVEPGASIDAAKKRGGLPIVFYGTSITQGGCASRAGMCHAAILGRWLDREVINLGFSGAGKMEPELADLLGELDAAVYVLECLPNMTTEMVRERAGAFVRRLRKARPTTPILLVENPNNPLKNAGNEALREVFAELERDGVGGLHYLPGAGQLDGREEGTVDGVHPTDLGFNRMAEAYEPVLRGILDGGSRAAEISDVGSSFDEQPMTFMFEPDVRVHINAPSAALFDSGKPVKLALYALPNGNTIEQTVGRGRQADRDWHYYIQHIGAQARRLREVNRDENLVVAYLEAGGLSWPTWRKKHPSSGEMIVRLVESLRARYPDGTRVELVAHSGGGSLIFGFINEVDEIPAWIGRIVWLDANYSYSDEQEHGDKLLAWLRGADDRYLGVVAYDDRRIRVDGKFVVGPTGGTYRATGRMLERIRADLALEKTRNEALERYRGLDGRVDIIRVENPEDKILHTVLVEKNGFIHGLTFGTPLEGKAGEFWGAAAYEKWIQP